MKFVIILIIKQIKIPLTPYLLNYPETSGAFHEAPFFMPVYRYI